MHIYVIYGCTNADTPRGGEAGGPPGRRERLHYDNDNDNNDNDYFIRGGSWAGYPVFLFIKTLRKT